MGTLPAASLPLDLPGNAKPWAGRAPAGSKEPALQLECLTLTNQNEGVDLLRVMNQITNISHVFRGSNSSVLKQQQPVPAQRGTCALSSLLDGQSSRCCAILKALELRTGRSWELWGLLPSASQCLWNNLWDLAAVFALPAAQQCCCLGEHSSSGAFLSWQILIIQHDLSRLENPAALQLPVL